MALTAPKPAPAKTKLAETDDELLAKSLTFCSLIPPMQERGAADDELLVAIRERWRFAPVHTSRPYRVDVKGTNTAIYFGREADGVTSLSMADGTLLLAVRRVLQIPPKGFRGPLSPPVDFDALKARGKSRVKADAPVPSPPSSGVRGPNGEDASQTQAVEARTPHPSPLPSKARGEGTKPPPVTAAGLLAGVEVLREEDLQLAEIRRSTENPREQFDEELIREMSLNITTICRLNPITVRESDRDGQVRLAHELLDGETRYRAATLAGVATVRVKIVRCTDAQAACLRLLTTVQRRDLNDIERAKALVALETKHGLSRQQLAELVGLKKDSVSNLTRLLELPEAWQARVISGEIAGSAVRVLVPWAAEPAVLAEVAKDLKQFAVGERSTTLPETLRRALYHCSRRLKDGYYYDDKTHQSINLDVKPTDELRCHKVGSEVRAFNLPLADRLIAEQVKTKLAAKSKAARKGPAQSGGLVDPAVARENAKRQRDQLAKRLYRFKIAWLQAACLADLADPAFDQETLLALLVWLTTRDGQHRRRESIEMSVSKAGNTKGRHPANLIAELLGRDGSDLWPLVRALVCDQVAGRFDGYHNVFDPSHIETLATVLDIQLKRDWPTSFNAGAACAGLWDTFVGLWSREQIIELLAEWKIAPKDLDVTKAKRGELAARLIASKPCPQSLLEAKPVPLT